MKIIGSLWRDSKKKNTSLIREDKRPSNISTAYLKETLRQDNNYKFGMLRL